MESGPYRRTCRDQQVLLAQMEQMEKMVTMARMEVMERR
jgi:hypothetical protein